MVARLPLAAVAALALTACASGAVRASSPASCVLTSNSAAPTAASSVVLPPEPRSYPAPAATSPAPVAESSIPQFPASDARIVTTTNSCQTLQYTQAYVSIAASTSGNPSAQHGEYEVATVWLANAGNPLPYGPADFVFSS